MKSVTIYHKETGRIRGHLTVSEDRDLVVPENHAFIDGHHDHRTHRVDVATGALVAHNDLPAPHPMQVEMQTARLRSALCTSAIEVLIAVALGKPGALERLEALDKQISDL